MKPIVIKVLSTALAAAILLSACNLVAPQATPTQDAQSAQATINAAVTQAMEAISRQLTSTAAALPTVAATATSAPTMAPTATATVVILPTVIPPTATVMLPTAKPKPTATATPANYACQLVAASPAAGTKVAVGADFDTTWQWKNVGTKSWEVGYVDLRYDSGQKMQTVADIFDITVPVAPGAEVSKVVDMRAPSTAGKYTATWKLMMENITLCTMTVSIEAVNP